MTNHYYIHPVSILRRHHGVIAWDQAINKLRLPESNFQYFMQFTDVDEYLYIYLTAYSIVKATRLPQHDKFQEITSLKELKALKLKQIVLG